MVGLSADIGTDQGANELGSWLVASIHLKLGFNKLSFQGLYVKSQRIIYGSIWTISPPECIYLLLQVFLYGVKK